MNEDQKRQSLEQMRDAFVAFTHVLLTIPGAPIQKQQAFHRFDEGHMWMQNAILSYQDEPVPPIPDEPVMEVENTPTLDVLPIEQQPVAQPAEQVAA